MVEPPGVSFEELPGAPLKVLPSEEDPPGPLESDVFEVVPPGAVVVSVDVPPGVLPPEVPEGEPEAFS